MRGYLEDQIRNIMNRHLPSSLPDPVIGNLGYVFKQDLRHVSYAYDPPADTPWENYTYDPRNVLIYDARFAFEESTLDKTGFELVNAKSTINDFTNEESIRTRYYPEVERIALKSTGAKYVYVFDHLVRRNVLSSGSKAFERDIEGQVAPIIGKIHTDYSESSGLARLEMVIQDPKLRHDAKRYSIVNVWKPLNGPVQDAPLAVCDARTVSTQDLIPSDLCYPNRIGELYLFAHSDAHRWFYFSNMTNDEAIVFKQFDSQLSGTSRFTPHASFIHPSCPHNVSPRESIEARCLVVY